jgi:CRISPR-associated RAMP protein (TIGR02581 family)
MLYHRFENRTIIHGVIEAIDPIHIGASAKESLNPVDLDQHVLKDANGLPLIPGSSLKGVVRSRFEAVMRSLDQRVCDIFKDKDPTCASTDEIKKVQKDKYLSDEQKAQALYDKSCTVCQLFGGRAVAGKLRFKDCSYIGEKCIFEKRDGVGIDRDTGAAAGKVKYDFEIIPKGSCFDFTLIAENLDAQQMKYLDFILRMLEGNDITKGDYLSIGGKTTRGLGRICLKEVKKTTMTREDMKIQMLNQLKV